MTYQQRNKRTHVAPLQRHIIRGIDGKFRLWTNIKANYMGAIPDYEEGYSVDYPVLTCIGVYETHQAAHKDKHVLKVEGEWKS